MRDLGTLRLTLIPTGRAGCLYSAAYVRAVEAAGYRLALTTDLGRVSTNPTLTFCLAWRRTAWMDRP